MKKFLVCFGKVFIKGPKKDSVLQTLLATCPEKYIQDAYVPELCAYLHTPEEADSEEEIIELITSGGFDFEDIFMIIDTEIGYAHVCNGLNVENMKKHCLQRFINLYKGYYRKSLEVMPIGRLYLTKTFPTKPTES